MPFPKDSRGEIQSLALRLLITPLRPQRIFTWFPLLDFHAFLMGLGGWQTVKAAITYRIIFFCALSYNCLELEMKLFLPTTPRWHFSNQQSVSLFLKLYNTSEESRLQENQTFLAKTLDATAFEPEKEKKNISRDLQKVGFAATDAVPKGFSGLFLQTTPRSHFSNQQSVSLFLKLYSSSKEPRLQENQTFLAKPAPRPPNRKRKKKNIARDLQKVGFCGHRCRSQRILWVRYEVLHLGFLSPR
ncbi:hypothetical protein CDAR_503071 [Caerostris darwini]|uniref:Uncharacterized protein n=1 Tax=Caerostris darwini TaxID=1538125 RepID=A0AAV4VPD6_9ARAC|nr:hypothetical protein CDAR_503071 [Caerostris darwini]